MIMPRWTAASDQNHVLAPRGRRDDFLTSYAEQKRRCQKESKDGGGFQGEHDRPTFEDDSRECAGTTAAATFVINFARPSNWGGDGRIRRSAAAQVLAPRPHSNKDIVFKTRLRGMRTIQRESTDRGV